jgi:hypothetical protein
MTKSIAIREATSEIHSFWSASLVVGASLLIVTIASPARAEHESFEEGFEDEMGRQVAAHVGAVPT